MQARYRLGAKCYQLDLRPIELTELFSKAHFLHEQAKTKVPEPTETATSAKLMKMTGARMAAFKNSLVARYQLKWVFVKMGLALQNQALPDLQQESGVVAALETSIAEAGTRHRKIQTVDTGLRSACQNFRESASPRLKQSVGWLMATSSAAGRLLAHGSRKIAAVWERRTEGTPLRRVKLLHILLGTAATVILFFLGNWGWLAYWPIDENDPKAVEKWADRLAAHPADGTKPDGVSGVSDKTLSKPHWNARALTVCIKAVENAPDNPRRLFELGRTLLLAGEADEAREFLSEAVELGHAGAKAYLGQLEPDPQNALVTYREAAALGFTAATEMADETQSYIDEVFGEAGQIADQLAAHPDDATRPDKTTGIPDSALQSEDALEKAVAACSDAVAAYPEDPRHRFQLGRVLLLAGSEYAADHLRFAAEKGHALGAFYLAHLEDDPLAAMGSLRQAVVAGYAPASQDLEELEMEVGPDFEGEGYHFGDLLRALYDWNGEFLVADMWENINYCLMLNEEFREIYPDLYSANVSSAINRDIKIVDKAIRPAVAIQDKFGPLTQLLPGPKPQKVKIPELHPEAKTYMKQDVLRLASQYGRDGEPPQRIAKHLQAIFY